MYVQRCTHTALHGGGCNVCTLKDHVPTIPYSRSTRVPKDRVTTYTVQYASGKRFRLTGRLGRVQIPGSRLMSPSIDPGAPQAMIVLDPRAMIRDPADVIVFQGCSTADLEADLAERGSAVSA